jgi:hypothetical protein
LGYVALHNTRKHSVRDPHLCLNYHYGNRFLSLGDLELEH